MPAGPVPFSESLRMKRCSCSLRKEFCSSSGWSQSWRARARHSGSASSRELAIGGAVDHLVPCRHCGRRDARVEPEHGLNGWAPPPRNQTLEAVLEVGAAHAVARATGTGSRGPRAFSSARRRSAASRAITWNVACGCRASTSNSSVELGVVGEAAGHELTVAVGVEPVRRHPERAVRERVVEQHRPSRRVRRRSRPAPTRRGP